MCAFKFITKRLLGFIVSSLFVFSLFSQGNVVSSADYQIKIFDENGRPLIWQGSEMMNLNPASNTQEVGNVYTVGGTERRKVKSGYTFKLFSNNEDLPLANGGQVLYMDKWGITNPFNVTTTGTVGTIADTFDCYSINLFVIKGPDNKDRYYLNFSTKLYTEIVAPIFVQTETQSTKEIASYNDLNFIRNDNYGSVFTKSFVKNTDIEKVWFGIPSDNTGQNFWWFNSDESLDPNVWSKELVASETKGEGTLLSMPGKHYYRIGFSSNKKDKAKSLTNNFNGIRIRVEDFGPAENFMSKGVNFFDEKEGKTILVGTNIQFSLRKIDVDNYNFESKIFFYDKNDVLLYTERGVFGQNLNLTFLVPETCKKCKVYSKYTQGTNILVYEYESEFFDIVTDTRIENKVELVAENKLINTSVYGGVCTDLNLRVPVRYNGEAPIYPYDEIKLYQYNNSEYQTIENAKYKDSFYFVEPKEDVKIKIKIDETETFNRKEVIYQNKDLPDNTVGVKMGYCAETFYSGNLGYSNSVKPVYDGSPFKYTIKPEDYKRNTSDKEWTIKPYEYSVFTEIYEFYKDDLPTGVESVAEGKLNYSVNGNCVTFNGDVYHIEVYNLSGIKVAESNSNEVEIPGNGIFIVKVDNNVGKIVL